jgi:hypothetical protein
MDKSSKLFFLIATLFFFCLGFVCLIFGIITQRTAFWAFMGIWFFFAILYATPISGFIRKLWQILFYIFPFK